MTSVAKGLVGAMRMPGIAWSFSRIGYRRHARRFAPDLHTPLAGAQLAVTGANSGLGFAVAKAWAQRHADVWMLCRNRERGESARQRLVGLGEGAVHLEVVDMADMASIDALVERLARPRLDALVHNAGALVHERSATALGLERTFACHVVGPQRLTVKLLPALERAPDPRVVYVASGGMYAEKLCVDDLLDPPQPFDGVRAYALAKRAQVVLVEQLAAASERVGFFAMHPGWVDTPGVELALPRFYRTTKRWLRTTDEGADTAVWLSTAPRLDVRSGAFVFDRRSAPRHILPGTRADAAERSKLWDAVTELAGANTPNEQRSTTAESPNEQRSTTAESPNEQRSTTAKSPDERRSTTAESPNAQRSTTAESPNAQRSTTAESPEAS